MKFVTHAEQEKTSHKITLPAQELKFVLTTEKFLCKRLQLNLLSGLRAPTSNPTYSLDHRNPACSLSNSDKGLGHFGTVKQLRCFGDPTRTARKKFA